MRLLLLTTIALVVAQQGWAAPQDAATDVAEVEKGPNPAFCLTADGYYPDPIQCDKYYECVDGVPTEKICPDGQAFKDDNHKREVCEYLFNVKCGLRTVLQDAQVSPNCPRANGYFAHPDPTNCQEFYYCVGGEPAHNSCPAGLHFSKNSGNCGWVAQAGREGCRKEVSANGFECPVVNDRLRAVSHPRYPNPDDCKLFYVCFNAQGPARDSGCDLGLVFDTELEACHPPSEVVGCENYYDGYFADYWANLFGAPADDTHLQIAGFLGYDIPEIAKKKPNVIQHNTNTQRRRTRPTTSAPAQVLRSGAQASRIPADDTPVAAEPHRFNTESTRPSRPQAPDTPKRRRPGVRRRKTTTTTTTTTTPKPAPVEPEYYDYEGDYYYYDDNSTLPIEGGAAVEVPSTTTTTTTTTTTPAPTTREAGPATRRRIPSPISRRRPVRPARPARPQPEDVVEA